MARTTTPHQKRKNLSLGPYADLTLAKAPERQEKYCTLFADEIGQLITVNKSTPNALRRPRLSYYDLPFLNFLHRSSSLTSRTE